MRRIKDWQPEVLTEASTFERGRERQMIVSVGPRMLSLRCQGMKQRLVISYAVARLHAAAAEAGFDPSPAKRARSGR